MTEKVKKILESVRHYPKLYKFLLERYKNPSLSWVQCALRAGYSRRSAEAISAENLRKPIVIGFIEALEEEQRLTATITKERAIEILKQIAETAPKSGERIAALKTLGDFCGWNAPQEVKQNGQIMVQMMIPEPKSLDRCQKR